MLSEGRDKSARDMLFLERKHHFDAPSLEKIVPEISCR
jgi:hypothetical protein